MSITRNVVAENTIKIILRMKTFELFIRFFSAQVVSPDLYGCLMNNRTTHHATITVAAKGSWDRRSIQ